MAEQFVWKQTLDARKKIIDEIQKLKDKERHAKWYKKNRKKVLNQQKKRDAMRDRKTYSKEYYLSHKEHCKEKNRRNYLRRKERMRIMNNKERIRALIGNIKNWSWDVYPQFKLEKEDAEALRDIEALKAYIKELEGYEKIMSDM